MMDSPAYRARLAFFERSRQYACLLAHVRGQHQTLLGLKPVRFRQQRLKLVLSVLEGLLFFTDIADGLKE